MDENPEQVLGRRVTIGPEHAHEAGGRDRGRLFEPREADGGVYVVAQDRAAGFFIPGEHEFDCLAEQGLAEGRLVLGAVADGFAKILCQGRIMSSLKSASVVVRPRRLGSFNVGLLALLSAAAYQTSPAGRRPARNRSGSRT